MHREDAFCFESALAGDVHTSGGGGNNLWRNIEEELPVIFYLWAGVVMTLDGARRLLQAHSMLVPMSRPACTLAVLRVKAHLQATRFPCRGPPPPCHSQVTLVPSELHGWVRRS